MNSQQAIAEEAIAVESDEKDVWPQVLASQYLTEDDYLGDLPKALTVSRLSQSLADACRKRLQYQGYHNH